MTARINRRQALQLGLGASVTALLAACDTTDFNFGPAHNSGGGSEAAEAPAQTFGTGATRVALLLPLTGDPALANVGLSMANAAQIAIDYVTSSKAGDNITLTLLDTGTTAQGAARQASAAVAAGVSLILGPLKADQVSAAGAVAKTAGIPLIGFSNNSSVAEPGVYLLNVLPESEVHRSLGYAASRGRRSVAALFPATDFGRVQQAAFNATVASVGLRVTASSTFGSVQQAQNVIGQLAGADILFLPDRATAPAIAGALPPSGGKLLIVGSADWDKDPAILATPNLVGAIYPAVDDVGYRALSAEYAGKFGSDPHPLATIAYTAVVLANAAPLAAAHYSAPLLTMPGGFNGRDGVFRFLADGRSQYALAIKQIGNGGIANRIEGPKL